MTKIGTLILTLIIALPCAEFARAADTTADVSFSASSGSVTGFHGAVLTDQSIQTFDAYAAFGELSVYIPGSIFTGIEQLDLQVFSGNSVGTTTRTTTGNLPNQGPLSSCAIGIAKTFAIFVVSGTSIQVDDEANKAVFNPFAATFCACLFYGGGVNVNI